MNFSNTGTGYRYDSMIILSPCHQMTLVTISPNDPKPTSIMKTQNLRTATLYISVNNGPLNVNIRRNERDSITLEEFF